ncbi:MAG: trypsin-like peptidase domain-containing protein, partial [Porticoccaceae bacterium]
MLKNFVVAIVFSSVFSSVQAQLPEFADLVENVSPAVVKINASSKGTTLRRSDLQGQLPDIFRELLEQRNRPRSERPARSMGSGFVISDGGYILTNHHVIDGADKIEVLFADRQEYRAEVIGSDRRSDLALLKIDAEDLPTLEFADEGELR